MDPDTPADDRMKKRKETPREPMQGGSDRMDMEDVITGGCRNLMLLRLSVVLAVAALLVPASARRPVAGLILIYRRLLSRFTPPCPSTPSCSAYALASVRRLGARRGLAAAAVRVRSCASDPRRSG